MNDIAYTVDTYFWWPIHKQNITVDLYPMKAKTEFCESIYLAHDTLAALLTMLILNLIGFLFFGLSMGYTWSLFLCL